MATRRATGKALERALDCLPRVKLNNIADLPGAKKKAIRVGRGPGSGHGKTSGRGHKGQGQRHSGTKPRIGFEGGQTPFYLRVPKHGFRNKFRRDYEPLNLSKLQLWIDRGRIDPNGPVTMSTLQRSGVLGPRIEHGVKLLGTGETWFRSKIDIEVSQASRSAIEAVEREGGSVVCAHYNRLGLRALLKPEKFEGRSIPRRALPPNKLLPYYMSFEKRGYLAEGIAGDELRRRVEAIAGRKSLRERRGQGGKKKEEESEV